MCKKSQIYLLGKRMSNILIGLKKNLFRCFTIEEIRDKDNATGLKEGRRNRNVNLQVLSIYHDARSPSLLNYLPSRIIPYPSKYPPRPCVPMSSLKLIMTDLM